MAGKPPTQSNETTAKMVCEVIDARVLPRRPGEDEVVLIVLHEGVEFELNFKGKLAARVGSQMCSQATADEREAAVRASTKDSTES